VQTRQFFDKAFPNQTVSFAPYVTGSSGQHGLKILAPSSALEKGWQGKFAGVPFRNDKNNRRTAFIYYADPTLFSSTGGVKEVRSDIIFERKAVTKSKLKNYIILIIV